MLEINIYELVGPINSSTEKFKFIHQTETHFNSLRKIDHVSKNFYYDYYGNIDTALKNIVDNLNKKVNLIEEYKFFPDNDLIFIKSNKQKSYYKSSDLHNIFSSREEIVLYCCDQINIFLTELYPYIISDLSPGNIFIQPDLKWITVDFDDFFYGAPYGKLNFNKDLQKQLDKYSVIKADHWPNCNDLDDWHLLPEHIKNECRNDFNFDVEKILRRTETLYKNKHYSLKQSMFKGLGEFIFNFEPTSQEEINEYEKLFIENINL